MNEKRIIKTWYKYRITVESNEFDSEAINFTSSRPLELSFRVDLTKIIEETRKHIKEGKL